MSTPQWRGILHGQTVVLSEPPSGLPDGTEVLVTPIGPRRGDPKAIVAALDELPPLSDEDAALMLRVIEEEFGRVHPEDWK